ncbi:putative chromosome segregation protein Spc25 [Lyophyllum shimeji]|uniref:Kinetochore protein SPC25 n=1 Tax=Lyophyllum shimeji TaxID=47721 RepID=A0A9P3PIQ3_LYOSH|nr:putative chromosome segregation protein Spc25 [Lyophyllum shimeji]
MRLPQIDLAATLAAPNPQIDLRLAVYEESTRSFLKAVSNYKNRAIASISERRTAQAAEKKRVLEKTQAVEAETNQCKLREIDLVADLEREKEERKDAELSVGAFKRQLATLREKCQSIEAEIEQYRAITANLRRERAAEKDTLRTHAARVSPELAVTERLLGCIVEGTEPERLLLRFAHIDPAAPDRECSLVLDIGGQAYKVVTSSPPLLALPLLVNTLNETRDIYAFVREVRAAYQTQLQPPAL